LGIFPEPYIADVFVTAMICSDHSVIARPSIQPWQPKLKNIYRSAERDCANEMTSCTGDRESIYHVRILITDRQPFAVPLHSASEPDALIQRKIRKLSGTLN
jgi:hypothetical protein